jgi:hypothetical protein
LLSGVSLPALLLFSLTFLPSQDGHHGAPTKTIIFRRYALVWWQEDEDDRLVTSPLQRAIRKVSYHERLANLSPLFLSHSSLSSQITRQEFSSDAISKFLPDILGTIAARPADTQHSNENLQLLLFLPALKDESAANAILDAIVKHSDRETAALLKETRAQDALVALVKQYGWPTLEDSMEKLLNVCQGSVLVYSILYLLENLDPSLPAFEEIKTWAVSQEIPDGDSDDGRCDCIDLALYLNDSDLLQRFVASTASEHSNVFKQALDNCQGSFAFGRGCLLCLSRSCCCFLFLSLHRSRQAAGCNSGRRKGQERCLLATVLSRHHGEPHGNEQRARDQP